MIRWLVGSVALVALSGAYFRVSLDDAFITAAYAQSLLETGELAYPGEARFEGVTSLPWVLVHAAALARGWDPILISKLVAGAFGVGMLAIASFALPMGPRGHWAFGALATWTPLAVWSAMAMETTAFALTVAAGWWCATRERAAWSASFGCLASVFRPEGVLWLLLSAGRSRRRLPFSLALVVVAAFHGLRWHYFGSIISGPMQMKAGLGPFGPIQVMLEAIGAIGVIVATRRVGPRTRAETWWLHAPLLLSIGVLLVIDGDWMGHGRLLVPGVAAMVCGAGALTRSAERPARWDTMAAVAIGAVLQTPFMEPPSLRALTPTWSQGLDVPLTTMLEPLLQTTSEDATVWCADVGVVGHIRHLRIVDTRGLVSPGFANARRSGRWEAIIRHHRSRPPDVIVTARFLPSWAPLIGETPGPHEGLDPWMQHLDTELLADYPHRRDVHLRERGWHGVLRFHHRHVPTRQPALWRARARALRMRFPAHPWFAAQLEAAEKQNSHP